MGGKRQSNSFVLQAKARNGTDGQGEESVYIRTKGAVAPYIADSENPVSCTDSNGKTSSDDGYLPSAGLSNGEVESNAFEDSAWGNVMGEMTEYGECTASPKGASETWPYEWVMVRKMGAPDAKGQRTWQSYSGTMTLHNNLAASALIIDIDNDNDQFGTDSDGKVLVQQTRTTNVTILYGTEEQAFLTTPSSVAPKATLRYDDGSSVPSTVATATIVPVSGTGNKKYLVTVTIKATGSNAAVFGSSGHTALYVEITGSCAKGGPKTIRFTLEKVMSGAPGVSPTINQLALTGKSFSFGRDASNSLTANSNSVTVRVKRTVGNQSNIISLSESGLTCTWGYDGTYTGNTVSTNNPVITIAPASVGTHTKVSIQLSSGDKEELPIVKDGAKGGDADYIYLRGTGNNNPGNRLVYISSQTNQSSYQGYGRGIEIVTVRRITLAKVESQRFDTYDGTDSGHSSQTAACNAAATYLNNLDNTVFVCITSLDAIGWNDSLIAALKNFGLGDLAYSAQRGRYPFAFLGYKGLQEGYALWQIHGTEATDPYSEVSAYIANGVFMSSKDGEATPVYSLVLDHTSVDFRSDATGAFLSQNKSVICTVRKREGSDSESAVSQSGGTYDSYYLRCRRVYRDNTYQSWQNSNTDTITTSLALYSDTNTNPVVGLEFCLSKTSSPTSSSIIATASCAVICDGRRGAAGATGKMFYPMGKYDPSVTYTRTGDLVPLVFYSKGDKTDWNAALGCYGNYYYLKSGFDSTVGVDPADGNSNPWQEASSFGVVITQGLFAEFAKMGKGIFSGDYLFSMNGELDSLNYNKGAAWKGYTAYTLFRGDPSVKGISVADGTVLTNNGYKNMVSSGIYLDSGEECVIKLEILSGTTSSNLIQVYGTSGQISFERWNYASTWSTAYEMGVSSGNTYYIRFTASASGTYNIRGGRNSPGTSTDKIVYHLNRILFKPNWWVDLLTGKMSAARGNFVVDADGSIVATNGTFDGLLRAKSMETTFADLTDKYKKNGNTYVALNGGTGSPGEYVLGEDVYEKVGSSYVKVDMSDIYNFVVGNTVFILPSDSAFISQRVLLFNGNINTAGGTSKGVTVETYEIEGGITTERYLRGVGKDVKYNSDTNVPTNHVLPSGAAVPLWSFNAVSRLFFVNGVVELIAVPDTEDAALCEWAVVNIGTNCYMID